MYWRQKHRNVASHPLLYALNLMPWEKLYNFREVAHACLEPQDKPE